MKKRHVGGVGLVVGALGVVFGDIGTSPLYAFQTVMHLAHITPTPRDIYGMVSIIVWTITIVVTLKYVLLIMRADNNGEGGILALLALLYTRLNQRASWRIWLMLGFAGLALFYGDSIITPAISVLSAVEGTQVALPILAPYVVPMTVGVLAVLFALQARGSHLIGRMFGPVMVVWFLVSGLGGLAQVLQHPEAFSALLPTTAMVFFGEHPLVALGILGGVVLVVTGAEALYADMGHFGRPAVRRAWLLLVFPALLLNYMGQGALVAHDPGAAASPYFLLFPESLRIPVLIVATLAALAASQAVISGAFSLTRQAVRLGYLPPMLIKHTSKQEVGQIYISSINWMIFSLVIALVVIFGSSANLASAYGVAVSGTLLIDSLLFFAVLYYLRHWSIYKAAAVMIGFVVIDSVFLASSLSKIVHGGWVPIVIALVAFTILTTWTKGHEIVGHERKRIEGTLVDFVSRLRRRSPRIPRIKGSAVYLSHHAGFTPLALHVTLNQLHELSSHVIVVSVETLEIPHVPLKDQAIVDGLGFDDDGISLVRLRFGFNDIPNVPRALKHLKGRVKELSFDSKSTAYFISTSDITIVNNRRMSKIRKLIYLAMQRNATSASRYFRLPSDRTVDMTTYIEL